MELCNPRKAVARLSGPSPWTLGPGRRIPNTVRGWKRGAAAPSIVRATLTGNPRLTPSRGGQGRWRFVPAEYTVGRSTVKLAEIFNIARILSWFSFSLGQVVGLVYFIFFFPLPYKFTLIAT